MQPLTDIAEFGSQPIKGIISPPPETQIAAATAIVVNLTPKQ